MFVSLKITCSLSLIMLMLSLTKTQRPINNKYSLIMDTSGSERDLAEMISGKSYVPYVYENQLPRGTIVTSNDNDVSYLLSKLSDEELLRLLNEQPAKTEYDLNDIAKVAVGLNVKKHKNNKKPHLNKLDEPLKDGPRQMGFFRLENKRVVHDDSVTDANYLALQKLQSLLYARPQLDVDDLDEKRKELLFDVLVNQLKLLCCKKPGSIKTPNTGFQKLKGMTDMNQDGLNTKIQSENLKPQEFMFLVINEEIRSNVSEEIILVDPDTLQQNSSILLLGPITTPLTNSQLKVIMRRLENELTKPEYTSLLQELSDGVLSAKNHKLIKSFIHGPHTRRYIKPHRCNHQSKLARVYGGPKWLICTGYINLNTPSLYD
ncbi:unnamed protein product [Leptidea sinapis]|uniref:Uncharacterized protein n=1 Tax=Leptidea sinapis TaxID=189913 RepID=A0A5E4R2V7_9NEOP|nr:unnamed protein product [Leptidea sinapis]